jgi:hypothetical protein
MVLAEERVAGGSEPLQRQFLRKKLGHGAHDLFLVLRGL